jgi:hypothetical protein
MKDFDNSLLTQVQSDEAISFWLVEMEIDDSTTVYYTTLDIDLVWDGQTWQTSEFAVNPVSYNGDLSVDKIQLKFSNVELAMSSLLLNNSVQSRPCTIYLGVLDNYVPLAEAVFNGLVSEWTLDETEAKIEIASELVFWNKKTLRESGSLCPWVFKGTECTYSGGMTDCNKTYRRCLNLNNQNYFGGFRFLPSIEEKEIWWGQSQK